MTTLPTIFKHDGFRMTFEVEAAVSQGQVVKVSSEGKISPCGAVSDKAIGVAYEDGDVGEHIAVVMHGVVEVTAGGAISVGSFVTPGTGGKVLSASEAAEGAGALLVQCICGIALKGAAADGDKIDMLICHALDKDTGT